MEDPETQSHDTTESKKDETVLAQMGEDPGLPADVITEQDKDSKEVDPNNNNNNNNKNQQNRSSREYAETKT